MRVLLYEPEKHRDQVCEMVEEFHRDSLHEYGLEFNRDSIEKYEKTHVGTTFVLEVEGEIVGIIGGLVIDQPVANKKVFQETIWFVKKSNRKHGSRQLSYLENWCLVNEVDQIIMAFMHNSMGERLYDFYQRMGYKPMETHLIKEVK